MCGRFTSYLPPDAIRRLFGTSRPVPNLPPSWNVAPINNAMVIRRHPETGERRLDLLRWGLIPSWTKDLNAVRAQPINARNGGHVRYVQGRPRPAALPDFGGRTL